MGICVSVMERMKERKREKKNTLCSKFNNKTLNFWYSLTDAIKKIRSRATLLEKRINEENRVERSGVEVERA